MFLVSVGRAVSRDEGDESEDTHEPHNPWDNDKFETPSDDQHARLLRVPMSLRLSDQHPSCMTSVRHPQSEGCTPQQLL